ncbi:transcription factor bHLH162-like [Durio zibethinus]|uniref:Transcription factor bHLH162-like n=1 Tax=Durio zibethinus TaxID=66656 RepID=A0A6P5X8D0_DURZI|nr:transcription factor bHLH162-like [Durio zibethinus]
MIVFILLFCLWLSFLIREPLSTLILLGNATSFASFATAEEVLSMESNPNSSSRTDRKLIERNRRNQMKALYSKLNSLIPHTSSREPTSLPDQLDVAANYIKGLQINLERLKERKDSLMRVERSTNKTSRSSSRPKSPQIQIHEMGSSLEIGLTTASNRQFIFNEIIRILHEEGAEIVNASFSVVDDTVFHTIHLTVGML